MPPVDDSSVVTHHLVVGEGQLLSVYVLANWKGSGEPPCAVVLGEVDGSPLIRIQSRCLYGELFGSLHCDCASQLHCAWEMVRAEGHGAIVYLDQEGRGAGLLAKARAYRAYELDGTGTFEAYAELGLSPDPRDYSGASEMLIRLGVTRARLLTNNPAKVAALRTANIVVSRVPLVTAVTSHAEAYLDAKRRQGHLL